MTGTPANAFALMLKASVGKATSSSSKATPTGQQQAKKQKTGGTPSAYAPCPICHLSLPSWSLSLHVEGCVANAEARERERAQAAVAANTGQAKVQGELQQQAQHAAGPLTAASRPQPPVATRCATVPSCTRAPSAAGAESPAGTATAATAVTPGTALPGPNQPPTNQPQHHHQQHQQQTGDEDCSPGTGYGEGGCSSPHSACDDGDEDLEDGIAGVSGSGGADAEPGHTVGVQRHGLAKGAEGRNAFHALMQVRVRMCVCVCVRARMCV